MPYIHRVAVSVKDLQLSAAFYGGTLGFRNAGLPDSEENGEKKTGFRTGENPALRLVLVEQSGLARGRSGAGALHHTAFTVPTRDALLRWKRYLTDLGVPVRGPFPRLEFYSIYFDDPDGATIELATRERNTDVQLHEDPETGMVYPPDSFLAGKRDETRINAESWSEPVSEVTPDMDIEGIHHVSALTTELDRVVTLLTSGLGFSLNLKTVNHDFASMPHYFFGNREGALGTLVTYFGNPKGGRLKPAINGTGTWHHVVLSVDEPLSEVTARLEKLGYSWDTRVPGGSVHFRDPDGLRYHLIEPAGEVTGGAT